MNKYIDAGLHSVAAFVAVTVPMGLDPQIAGWIVGCAGIVAVTRCLIGYKG